MLARISSEMVEASSHLRKALIKPVFPEDKVQKIKLGKVMEKNGSRRLHITQVKYVNYLYKHIPRIYKLIAPSTF